MITRHYASLDCPGGPIQAHYRAAGDGPPLILLHPSPLSGAFMAPLLDLFAPQVHCYAPDTPGYGASDPLPEPAADLAPYVDWLARLLDALGLDSAGVYGSATGAQIGIQFARTHPDRARYLVVENAVHFDDAERERIVRDYFPDMTPQADGSHFELAWEMASRLFKRFPWFDDSEDAIVASATPPVEVINATALAYLAAGPDYDRAYRAAFANESAHNLQAVTCPVRVIRWQGSILRRHAARLDDFEWPEHIRMVPCGPTVEARYEALTNVIAELGGQ